MIAWLIAALLLANAGTVYQVDTGSIAGMLRTEDGAPASAVRVAAAVSDSALADAELVSITETDAMGRYRLENLPPGEYHVIAGRVAAPVYYPDATNAADARPVAVTAGAVADGIDMVIPELEVRLATAARTSTAALIQMRAGFMVPGRPPVVTFSGRITGTGGLPLLSGVMVIAARADGYLGGGTVAPDGSFQMALEAGDYALSVAFLPLEYAVATMNAGSTDLMTGQLHSDPAQSAPATVEIVISPRSPR